MMKLTSEHTGANCIQLVKCLIRLNPESVCFVLSYPTMVHMENRFQKMGSGMDLLQNEVDDKVETMYAYVLLSGRPLMIHHMSEKCYTKIFGDSQPVEKFLMELVDLENK